MERFEPTLDGVSATTLWTLRNRAAEAKRSDGVITDPWAITLLDGISCDYSNFGKHSQIQALRARAFDMATVGYLTEHPRAAVVALAEGLQTSMWRLDATGVADDVSWYSLDLWPVMALRERLLPADDRIVPLTQSALDPSWMDCVDPSKGVIITAEGLLMYLEREDVFGLIRDCAVRFPGAQMVFDSIPHWFSRRTMRGLRLSEHYTSPPMPFALNVDEALALPRLIDGVEAAREVFMPPGRGLSTWMWKPPIVNRIGFVRRNLPTITVIEFAS